ncbi:MAG: IPT/TIG domain-containing protein [Marmoricola sp.]
MTIHPKAVSRAGIAVIVAALALAPALIMSPAGATTAGSHHGPRTWFPPVTTPPRATPPQAACSSVGPPPPTTTCPHLSYFGGPVLAHAQVESVLWGPGSYQPDVTGTASPNMDGFFSAILHSPYLSWLDEYRPTSGSGTNTRIGYGDFLGRTQITPSHAGTTVTDNQIQAELAAQISSGALPAPTIDANGVDETVYALFFPHGTTISTSFGTSGVQFCAYHSTTTVNGVAVSYNVLPDLSTITGCGGTSPAQALQLTESHELAETITDPYVGLDTASVYAAPAAWGDNNNGEIADICDGAGSAYSATILSYSVQDLWSNASNGCISTKTAQPAPTNVGAALHANSTATLSWTPPSGTLSGYDVYASSVSGRIGQVIGTPSATATTWTTPAVPAGTVFSLVAENSAAVSSDPVVAVASAPDGYGSATISPAQATVGATGRTLTFTYTPNAQLTSGGLSLVIPSTWTAPSITKTAAGYVTSTCGTVSITSRTVNVKNVTTSNPCAIVYGSRAGNGPGLRMPATKGTVTFPMSERTTASGTLKPLAAAPTFQLWAAPTVTGVSPNSGSKAGGMTITISGTGFMPGDTVAFAATLGGSLAGTNVTVISSTQLTAVVPASTSTGVRNVVVTSPGGVKSATNTHDTFTYK